MRNWHLFDYSTYNREMLSNKYPDTFLDTLRKTISKI